MNKKYFIKLVTFSLLIFLSWTAFCYATEMNIQPSDWPNIPFAQQITVDSTLPNYIAYFFALGIYLGGVLTVISLAIAGVQLIMSAENPENRGNAISRIKASIMGLIILFSSFIIINTINVNLKNIKEAGLFPVGGPQFTSGTPDKSRTANFNIPDLGLIRSQGFGAVSWPSTITATDGSTKPNCDVNNPNLVYVIYWFKDKNYQKFDHITRLKCNGSNESILSLNSYIMVKEQPGVYFYSGPNCTIPIDSDSSFLPIYSTKSMPAWRQDGVGLHLADSSGRVNSMRIVNGSDPLAGPFFGVVAFNNIDYKTTGTAMWGGFRHFPFVVIRDSSDNYSTCIDDIYHSGLSQTKGSFIIYQWAGYNSDGSKKYDTGVTLYTGDVNGTAWTGGNVVIDGGTIINGNRVETGGIWYLKLDQTPVIYTPDSGIPETKQVQCATFDGRYQCLGSFEIQGNFLVLVSTKKDLLNQNIDPEAQAFPISARLAHTYTNSPPEGYAIQRGTPGLENEYIKNGNNANYMEIIPLAAPYQ